MNGISDISKVCAITVALVLLVATGIHAVPHLLLSAVLWRIVDISSPLVQVARLVYRTQHRDIVQLNPACARYHQALTYTLKPQNTCQFTTFEFATTITTDSDGLRNPRAKLVPHIAVVGDSHAMGWGVADTATFAEVLEQLTGTEVRNYSMSSYGTARELLSLSTYGKHEPYVIIQYCDNDLAENQAFVSNGRLNIKSQEQFAATVHTFRHQPWKAWYHFSFGLALLSQHAAFRAAYRQPAPLPNDLSFAEHVGYFVQTLATFSDYLQGTQVIVFYSNAYGRPFADFLERLTQYLSEHPLPFAVSVSGVNEVLDSEAYFVFDDHLNATGHQRIAQYLAQDLARLGQGR